MKRLHASVLVPAALLVVLAFALSRAATQVFRMQEAQRFDIRYLPASRPLRALSPAVQLSVANYWWLQTVQYLGDQALRRGSFEQVFPLVDLVTDLDPGHGYAYQTGGLALSSALRLEESDAILKKGMQRGPGWWSYPFYIAFNDFYYRGDYASAARWAEIAARTPGASTRISALALALNVKSGAPEHAVRFIEEMLASATDEGLRAGLEEQYRSARLQHGFAILDAAVERFRAARGHDPARLEDLLAAGLLERVPEEPFGGAYVWRDGAVHSTGRDVRVEPAEPGRLRRPVPYKDAR
ncbi:MULTISPECIES: tetratricopeptide repeat protein [unclassified Anaeromyxobacter]|uniref:tetratricopeptide repeat protein n=1 Tax=unclassified Anaeromyxobacter TaxID=2620896 RepID=UPI001F571D23|nr:MULTISPECIES: tetratricopeptide repeat protein [unclassified Anaeromyxobacter]